MRTDLKLSIINFMFENAQYFQLVNHTTQVYRQYIYDEKGNYCFGGKEVSDFISMVDKLIRF